MRRVLASLAVMVTVAAGCSDSSSDDNSLTLVTHDSFAVSDDVLEAFTAETGVKVKVLPAGDAGATLNQAILTADDPLGDVIFGVDNTFLSRAADADILVPYESPELASVPAEFQLDAEHGLTPIDYGDVCINFDKEYFAQQGLAVPETLEDLTAPEYRGLLVTENPATSSPGLAFLLATVAEFGEDGWRDYWQALRDNDVEVVAGWEEAFNGEFSAGEGRGDRPLVVSYASSPPVAVYFSDPPPAESPIGTQLESCFRQIEFAGILDGTGNRRAAEKVVDFLLSRPFQEDMPLQMFVYPVLEGARLPPAFVKYAQVAPEPLSLPPAEIAANRDRWIDEWTDIVLR